MKKIIPLNQGTAAGSIDIESIFLVNHQGDEKDIVDMVATLSITESLFTPYLSLKLGVLDQSNFFEFFSLSGNEKIILKVVQRPYGEEEIETEMVYRVLDYPRYTRGNEGQTQNYLINCITEAAYYSELKNISRGYDGPLVNEIRKIITKDLSTPLRVLGNSSASSAGVFEWTHPMIQALDFTQSLSSPNGSPFFLYASLNRPDALILRSYEDMVRSVPYHTYYDRVFMETGTNTGTKASEAEQYYTIREMKSFLGLNRLESAKNGAYASRQTAFDLSRKSISQRDYRYDDREFPSGFLSGKSNHYENFSPLSDQKNFSAHPEVVRKFSLLDSHRFNGSRNSGDIEYDTGAIMDSYDANMETLSHEIRVAGDLLLNPGRVIELDVPKATDLNKLRSYHGDDEELRDLVFSRKYLVTTSIHKINLSVGTYQTTFKVVTDSIR